MIKDDNPHITFATDDDYNQVFKKSDDALMTTKYYQYYPEQAEKKIQDNPEYILEEFLVVTEEESKEDTDLYLTHAQRLNSNKLSDEQNEQAKE